jgi:hypothetical protein
MKRWNLCCLFVLPVAVIHSGTSSVAAIRRDRTRPRDQSVHHAVEGEKDLALQAMGDLQRTPLPATLTVNMVISRALTVAS